MSADFTLEIDASNAAFDDEPREVARLLREAARDVEAGFRGQSFKDLNGNTVGGWHFGAPKGEWRR